MCCLVLRAFRCQGVRVLHVAPLVSWTSYMVFATVFSKPQLLAALARIEMMAGERFSDRIKQNVPGGVLILAHNGLYVGLYVSWRD